MYIFIFPVFRHFLCKCWITDERGLAGVVVVCVHLIMYSSMHVTRCRYSCLLLLRIPRPVLCPMADRSSSQCVSYSFAVMTAMQAPIPF